MVDVSYQPYVEAKSPYVIQDTMDALRNHADGRMYDSKSEFRRATKRAGYEEMGNERMPERSREWNGPTTDEIMSIPKVRGLING
jgi:hypothetical protein